MLFKICRLSTLAFLLSLWGCSDHQKELEYDELDRMAQEILQPIQHQKIVEEEPSVDQNAQCR